MSDHTSDRAEPRSIVLSVAGIRHSVPAVYHREGALKGCLEVTGRPFFADAGDSHYGHCGMVLKPAARRSPHGVADSRGDRWEPEYRTSIQGRPARITGWAQALVRQRAAPRQPGRATPDFGGRGLPGPGTGLGDRW
ncbi:hypothetical protein ACFVU3_21890 [Streptomyces sp. NPDC058052]|uniref:hypothetical protein n=1 Tax=Streptomyces sp. NPDC058052 TaxID=3346316 RepID=UPI0036EADAD4